MKGEFRKLLREADESFTMFGSIEGLQKETITKEFIYPTEFLTSFESKHKEEHGEAFESIPGKFTYAVTPSNGTDILTVTCNFCNMAEKPSEN